MQAAQYDLPHVKNSWCPGCGNFPILTALKQALAELDLPPEKVCIVSGIGQAAKVPHYLKCHFFNGLHGRALPPATAVKASNPGLTVVAVGGDGDMYSEGGNHLIHAIRRNPDLTLFVHNNMVYGLTKGQGSPTSLRGFVTPIQVNGVANEPFNPLAVAVALDCGFVARANAADIPKTKEIMKEAIRFKGFALVDLFQACVSFNKLNTYQWYKEHTYYLDASHDPADRMAAFARAVEMDRYPLGVLYRKDGKPTFEEQQPALQRSAEPLYGRRIDPAKFRKLLRSKAV